jgi:hypothetical protein
LELHQSGNDYVVIFDHHEDVSTLDSEEQPTILIGDQIKTKDPGRFRPLYNPGAIETREGRWQSSKSSAFYPGQAL